MKINELAMLINDIDEDMVEDAWTENGLPILISDSRSLNFWKVAAVTAACFAAVITGVFCIAKMKPNITPNVTPPNDSASESSVSTDEYQGLSYPTSLPEEGEENIILIDKTHKDTILFADKFEETTYVQLNIEETNASEENPVYFTIYDAGALIYNDVDLFSSENCISETVRITEPGGYAIKYTRDHGLRAVSCMKIECDDLDGLILKGNWIP